MLVHLRDGSPQKQCCHTEIKDSDQTFYLNQSQYTDTGLITPSADATSPGAWQGSHWSASVEFNGMTGPGKLLTGKAEIQPGSAVLKADALTTRPTRRKVSETGGSGTALVDCEGSCLGRQEAVVQLWRTVKAAVWEDRRQWYSFGGL